MKKYLKKPRGYDIIVYAEKNDFGLFINKQEEESLSHIGRYEAD